MRICNLFLLLGITVFFVTGGPACVRYQAPIDASSAQKSGGTDTSQPIEITDVFDSLVASVRAGDLTQLNKSLSIDRMIKETEKQKAAHDLSASDRAVLRTAVLANALKLLREGDDRTWDHLELETTEFDSDEREAAVSARIDRDDGSSFRMQFWLCKEQSGWRIYDWTNLGGKLRVSTNIGIIVASLAGETHSLYVQMLAAARRLAHEEKLDEAEEFLQRIADAELPTELESERWILYARIKSSQGLTEEALRCLDFADSYKPSQPVVLAMRADAHCELGNYDTALELARKVSEEPDVKVHGLALVGNALRGMERHDEAADAYRQGLAIEPDSLENLIGLGIVLSKDKMSEFVERLSQLSDLKVNFEALAGALLAAERSDALETVVAAFKKLDTESPLADYYAAEAKVLKGEHDDAVELFAEAHARFAEDQSKYLCERKLLDVLLSAGKPLAAYQRATDSDYAFGHLADELLASKKIEQVSDLVSAHRAKAPDDIRLHYYSGQAHILANRLEDAQQDFAKGMAAANDDDQRERFRSERVLTLFKLGKSLDAYEQVAPPQTTYEQLTKLLADSKQADVLESLIEAHRRQNPDDPTLGLWKGEVHWLREDYQGVVTVFTDERDTILADDLSRDRFEDRLIRSLVRLGRYYEALNIAKTSSIRDGDPWYEALVHAAAGNVNEAAQVLEYCSQMGYTTERFHDDADLGPALRTDAFAAIRNKYPIPSSEDAREEIIMIIE